MAQSILYLWNVWMREMQQEFGLSDARVQWASSSCSSNLEYQKLFFSFSDSWALWEAVCVAAAEEIGLEKWRSKVRLTPFVLVPWSSHREIREAWALPENLYFNQNMVIETPVSALSLFWRVLKPENVNWIAVYVSCVSAGISSRTGNWLLKVRSTVALHWKNRLPLKGSERQLSFGSALSFQCVFCYL